MKRIIVEIKNKQTEVKKEGKVRVAAYCRVSTLKDEQKLSYESQCSYYEELIKSDGNMELVGVYGDQGFSGPHADNRLEFQRLIRDAVEGKIDHIIVEPISLFLLAWFAVFLSIAHLSLSVSSISSSGFSSSTISTFFQIHPCLSVHPGLLHKGLPV